MDRPWTRARSSTAVPVRVDRRALEATRASASDACSLYNRENTHIEYLDGRLSRVPGERSMQIRQQTPGPDSNGSVEMSRRVRLLTHTCVPRRFTSAS